MKTMTTADIDQIEKRLKHLEQTSDIGGLALHAVKYMPQLIEIARAAAAAPSLTVVSRPRLGV